MMPASGDSKVKYESLMILNLLLQMSSVIASEGPNVPRMPLAYTMLPTIIPFVNATKDLLAMDLSASVSTWKLTRYHAQGTQLVQTEKYVSYPREQGDLPQNVSKRQP